MFGSLYHFTLVFSTWNHHLVISVYEGQNIHMHSKLHKNKFPNWRKWFPVPYSLSLLRGGDYMAWFHGKWKKKAIISPLPRILHLTKISHWRNERQKQHLKIKSVIFVEFNHIDQGAWWFQRFLDFEYMKNCNIYHIKNDQKSKKNAFNQSKMVLFWNLKVKCLFSVAW